MSEFIIKISPELPEIVTHHEISLDGIDFARVYKQHPEEYDVIYKIDNFSFQYYPTSIATVLNDLHQEWELVRSRTSHEMTLSGYRVLDMLINGDNVIFENPTISSENKKQIGESFSILSVEETFRSATERVLNEILRNI